MTMYNTTKLDVNHLDINGLAALVFQRQAAKRDMIVDTKSVWIDEKDFRLNLDTDTQTYAITQHAHGQIQARLKIPAVYYKQMLKDAPALLATNVNHWFGAKPEKRMIRTLDGNARAFLSNGYQRFDHEDVLEGIVPVIMNRKDLEIKICALTEQKMHIRVMRKNSAVEVKRGDWVEAGAVITNGELGDARIGIQPFVNRLVCTNGLVMPEGGYSRSHIGRRVELGDQVYAILSDETKRLDIKTIISTVRDMLANILSEEAFTKIVDKMKGAAESVPVSKDPIKVIQELSKSNGLTDEEGNSFLKNFLGGGDMTRWGVLNAATALGHEATNADREHEFFALGGKILNMSAPEWENLAVAA
jgi:hypothetical protein